MRTTTELRPHHDLTPGPRVSRPWVILTGLALLALATACDQTDTTQTQTSNLVSTPSSPSDTAPPADSSALGAPGRTVPVASTGAVTAPVGINPEPELEPQPNRLTAFRQLRHADQAASSYKIVGPNTRHIVALYDFFEKAGWNDAIDSVTMKSCPEGYEFFCQLRDVCVQLYEQSGGDVESLIELSRKMDLRVPLYQLAVVADAYNTSTQVRPSAGNSDANGRPTAGYGTTR